MPTPIDPAPSAAWPPGAGEMARCIRAHDWAATPLGPSKGWPERLRTTVDILLASGLPMVALCGPELIQVYNDGYRRLMGTKHPAGLGQPTRECWPEIWHVNAPIYARVQGGETVTLEDARHPVARHGMPEDAWFTLSCSPVSSDGGNVAGVLVTMVETKAKPGAEAARREIEARQAFLLKLSDALRPVADPAAIMRTASRMAGEHLDADRAAYGELEPGDEMMGVSSDWHREEISSTVGRFRIDDFGTFFAAPLRAGLAARIDDARADPRIPPEVHDRTWGLIGARSAIACPVVKQGRFVAAFFVHCDRPRRWAEDDVTLASQVADRTWEAVERARAETALRESEERFRSFAENSTDVLRIADAESGRLEYLSPSFAAVWGESRERVMADIGRWAELIHPEDRAGASRAMPRTAAGETVTQSYRIVRPSDGAERWVQDTGFPIRDGSGRIRRVGGIAQDLTERTRSELEVSARRRELRVLVETIPQLVWRGAEGGRWIWASPQWSAFTGQPERESHGWGWLAPVHPDDREQARTAWQAAGMRGRFEAEYRLRRRDGDYRWFQTRAMPVHAEGGVLEWIGTSTDIDDTRHMQEHEKVLVAELQHRVRNTLGVIRSIMRRTARTSPTLEAYVMDLDGRIEAFSRVQSTVTRAPMRGVDLEYLVAEELRAVGAKEGDNLSIRGTRVAMSAKAAETVGLAVHELATNALKHGALAVPRGEIKVRWKLAQREEGALLDFQWTEQGMRGLPPSPARRGFGTEILTRTLAYELKARTALDFRPTGVSCRIEMPLSSLVMPEQAESLH